MCECPFKKVEKAKDEPPTIIQYTRINDILVNSTWRYVVSGLGPWRNMYVYGAAHSGTTYSYEEVRGYSCIKNNLLLS